MSEQERPEWAKGDEWKGWTLETPGSLVRYINKSHYTETQMMIDSAGHLLLTDYDREEPRILRAFAIPTRHPEAALRVANCIAKELGGWPGEEA